MRLRLVTYNAGLLDGGVPLAVERAPHVIGRLAGLEADIVCLQELWEQPHRESLVAAAGDRFPHIALADPLPPRTGDWGFAGDTGVMVLSRFPLGEVEAVELPSTIVRRAVLRVVVEAPFGAITVLATHLTAVLPNVEHEDGAGGWEAEHLAQVHLVRELAAAAAGPVVLAGDLNCGPALPGMRAELPRSYLLLRSAFEHSPYAEADDPPCTWCEDNPLVLLESPAVIDHVMTRGLVPGDAKRVLDETILLDSGGAAIESRLSDHYGVAVELGPA